MGRAGASSSLVQGVDQNHGGADRAGAVERAPPCIRQLNGPEPLLQTFLRAGQATDQRRAHQRVARYVRTHRFRHIALPDRRGPHTV